MGCRGKFSARSLDFTPEIAMDGGVNFLCSMQPHCHTLNHAHYLFNGVVKLLSGRGTVVGGGGFTILFQMGTGCFAVATKVYLLGKFVYCLVVTSPRLERNYTHWKDTRLLSPASLPCLAT